MEKSRDSVDSMNLFHNFFLVGKPSQNKKLVFDTCVKPLCQISIVSGYLYHLRYTTSLQKKMSRKQWVTINNITQFT